MNTPHWIAGIVVLMGLQAVPAQAAPTDAELASWTEECRALASITSRDQDGMEKNTIICLAEMYRMGADEVVNQTAAIQPVVAAVGH